MKKFVYEEMDQQKDFLLDQQKIIIGRHKNCDFTIRHLSISKNHNLLEYGQSCNEYMNRTPWALKQGPNNQDDPQALLDTHTVQSGCSWTDV